MEFERARLQVHASGKMARALGDTLPGESKENLDRIAAEDQRLAQEGMVKLKVGQEIHYKRIDELTREDLKARIEAERTTKVWLRGRIKAERIVAKWRQDARYLPSDHTS
jgi:hypothetical protein